MKNVKVENMVNSKGNVVKNQFIIETVEGEYFQSYKTVIAFKNKKGEITLDKEMWDFSATTKKYLNYFLGGQSAKETRAKIESGEYRLVDLN